jgi:hypothetical protein
MPFHTHAALCHGLEKSLSERHGRVMAQARHGHGLTCVNQTRSHCVNQIGNTQSKPLAARHGNGMACGNQTQPHCVNQMGNTQSKHTI